MAETDRRAEARDYLGDDLQMEAEEHPEDEEWYLELADWLRGLSVSDVICEQLAVVLAPFLDDDDRIDGAMYPAGQAVSYMDSGPAGGDYRAYIEQLLEGLTRDYQRWIEHVATTGDFAAWSLETGPPPVPSDNESK
jgi:hypothetical protein